MCQSGECSLSRRMGRFGKRIACVILVAIVILITMAGCDPAEYTGKAVPVEDMSCGLLYADQGKLSAVGMKRAAEREFYAVSFHSDLAAPEKTILFDGKEYTGIYQSSSYVSFGCLVEALYRAEHTDGSFHCFSVDSETGEVLMIDFDDSDFYQEDLNAELLEDPDQVLPDIAEKWASLYIEPEDYVLRLNEKYTYGNSNMTEYDFEFVRVVNSIDTTDSLIVHLSNRGKLMWINTGYLGWVEENIEKVPKFSKENVQALIQENCDLSNIEITEMHYDVNSNGEVILLVNCTGHSEEEEIAFCAVVRKTIS